MDQWPGGVRYGSLWPVFISPRSISKYRDSSATAQLHSWSCRDFGRLRQSSGSGLRPVDDRRWPSRPHSDLPIPSGRAELSVLAPESCTGIGKTSSTNRIVALSSNRDSCKAIIQKPIYLLESIMSWKL